MVKLANVQPENGYTKIANELLEEIVKRPFNGTQLRIVLVVWRYTYGFQRKDHELSVSFICKATGISKRQIQKELQNLIENRVVIEVNAASFNKTRKIAFNKNYEAWIFNSGTNVHQVNYSTPPEQEFTSTGELQYTSPGELQYTQERNIKEKYKENIIAEIQDLRLRYSPDIQSLIDQYWNMIKKTRKTNSISDNVILKTMQQWKKFDEVVIHHALKKHIEDYDDGEHDEKYTLGIIRNTTTEQAADMLNRKAPIRQKAQSKTKWAENESKGVLDEMWE